MITIFNQENRNKLSLWLLVFAVALLPLFKGGNYPGVMSCFFLAMVVVVLLSIRREGYERIMPFLMVWIIVSSAVLIHAVIFPLFFSNKRFFDYDLAIYGAQALEHSGVSNIRLIEIWSYFTAMWVVVWRISTATKTQISILLTVLFVMSVFQALFGVAHFLSGEASVLGLWTKEHYLGDATGTFVNRNHFSGMLAISAPLVVGGLLASKALIFPSLSRANRLVISVFYLMLIFVALISAHSRMGMLAAVLGMFVCVVLLIKPSGGERKLNILPIVGVVLFLFLFITWFGFADIMQRYTQLSDGNSRLDVWRAMVAMPIDVWLVGVGPGYFEDVFQIIKPNYFSVRFIYAHNDYLEFVFEFGLLLSSIILFSLVVWYKCLRLKEEHIMKAGVYGAISAIAIHSLVDFNLQIPASALCFCVALGLLVNPFMLNDSAGSEVGKKTDNKGSKRRVRLKSGWPKTKREWLAFLRSD